MTIVLVAEFYLVLRDVQQTIVRDRHGEKIASGLVESAINQVVSKRMVKKQQMGWSQRGAHLLLQIRTRVLDEEWENTFRRWYLAFRPQEQAKKAARPHEISRSPFLSGFNGSPSAKQKNFVAVLS